MLLIVAPSSAAANPAEQLDTLITDYWEFYLREHPTVATRTGRNDYNDRLPAVSEADNARRLSQERRFLEQLVSIEHQSLSADDRINAELLRWVLEDSILAYELDLSRIPFNTFSGFFMTALTAGNGVRMETVDDYEDYLTRLQDIPRYFAENIDNMRRGSEDGFVLPQVVIDGVLPTIAAQVKDDPTTSSFYAPFESMNASLDASEQERLKTEAKRVIAGTVMPAFAGLAEFLRESYAASASPGASELPGGADYYAFQIRRYTTLTDATADSIHETGLAEVDRIRREMQAILDELEFDGDLEAFTTFLRNDPQFYASSAEDLMKETSYTAKRIDYVMPGFFGRLPRQPYGVVPVPDEIAPNYTTGAYYGAPLGGDRGGAYWINTYGLDQRPLYELPALTLHEAVPGHHHQNALAKELTDLPDYRRNLYFSAFGEGWALYAEKLGVEMGIYRNPYEHFGRLSYEMWRACRLVIDTGIHARGWSRDRAIEFLGANTSLSRANIRAEVDRYISWPGQALSYKLGELKIWELRRKAEAELGDEFDLRQFHDVVLQNGALPIAMLERVVMQYVDEADGG